MPSEADARDRQLRSIEIKLRETAAEKIEGDPLLVRVKPLEGTVSTTLPTFTGDQGAINPPFVGLQLSIIDRIGSQ